MIGPKVDKVWSAEPVDEKTQMMIARQVLNGEIGSCSIESKWVLLQSMICTAFLFEDPTVRSLFAIVLVVPTRYQKNFSQYFQLLKDRVPIQLVQPLIHLRKMQKRESVVSSTRAGTHMDILISMVGVVNSIGLFYRQLANTLCDIHHGFRISFFTYGLYKGNLQST